MRRWKKKLNAWNAQLADWGREGAWRMRAACPWSLPAWHRPRSWASLMRTLPPPVRPAAEALASRYPLQGWGQVCDVQGFRESLYVLDVLDRYVGRAEHPAPSLDIGCKNGCYLPGLHAWSGGAWDGVELDAYRRYWTLTTRRAHGERVARCLPGCRYVVGDVREMHGSYGFITWFLPFLHEAPLQAWGLPRRFLAPLELLQHAWGLVAPYGRLFVVNQDVEEARMQAQLFQQAGIVAVQALGPIESLLSPFQRPRFGWLAHKDRYSS